MNPDLLLGILAALADFVLKTTSGFVVCLALSWLADSPTRRFIVWSSFLYGATAYWLWMANGFLTGAQLPGSSLHTSIQQVTSTAGTVQIPGSWAFPLGVAFRVAGIAYLLVLSCMLLTHIKKQRQLKWVLRFTTKPPAEIASVFQSLAASLHVGRSRLLVLSGVASPATFGWIRPIILLPDDCLLQERSQLEDILRHELHHIRRWDFLWNGCAFVCRALLFFHPAAWYAVRKAQFDRELACDLAVVRDSPARRARYAEGLIHFARLKSSQDPTVWGIDFAASSEHLKARVQSILAGPKALSNWSLGLRLVCGLTFILGFLGVVPSLAILLSYAHQRISQPLTSVIRPAGPRAGTKIRPARKLRSSTSSTSRDAAVADVTRTKTTPFTADDSADHEIDRPSSTQTLPGPHLLHRPSQPVGNSVASDAHGANQQTIALEDPGSGQGAKSEGHEKLQTLQQSATAAAGLYRRIGAVDRH